MAKELRWTDMELKEFSQIYDEARNLGPLWFRGEMEEPATAGQIAELISTLGVALPNHYVDFLGHFGAGYFGPMNIFSARPESELYLPKKIEELQLPRWFVPVSDDETGGFYGFVLSDARCSTDVYYYCPSEDPVPSKKFSTFFTYAALVGLRHQ